VGDRIGIGRPPGDTSNESVGGDGWSETSHSPNFISSTITPSAGSSNSTREIVLSTILGTNNKGEGTSTGNISSSSVSTEEYSSNSAEDIVDIVSTHLSNRFGVRPVNLVGSGAFGNHLDINSRRVHENTSRGTGNSDIEDIIIIGSSSIVEGRSTGAESFDGTSSRGKSELGFIRHEFTSNPGEITGVGTELDITHISVITSNELIEIGLSRGLTRVGKLGLGPRLIGTWGITRGVFFGVHSNAFGNLEDISRPHTDNGWWIGIRVESSTTSLFSWFGFVLPSISGVDTVGHSEWNNDDFTTSGSGNNTDFADHEVHVSELEESFISPVSGVVNFVTETVTVFVTVHVTSDSTSSVGDDFDFVVTSDFHEWSTSWHGESEEGVTWDISSSDEDLEGVKSFSTVIHESVTSSGTLGSIVFRDPKWHGWKDVHVISWELSGSGVDVMVDHGRE